MIKLNTQSRIKGKLVTPSTRDSISTWLDVLTSMLALSGPERTQVRDELEDHLRSRVDDLLIVGKAELDAIQIAVAELGETAELAKLITHAHTRINPRRKIMNAAMLTVALAGMSFGGYSFINGTGAPSATPNNRGLVPVVIPEETRANSQPTDKLIELTIEAEPTLMAFEKIAYAFGYAVDFHSLDIDVLSNLQHEQVDIVGEMTIERALQSLVLQTIQFTSEQLVTEFQGDSIELLSQDESIRRMVTTRVLRLNDAEEHDLFNAGESLNQLLQTSENTDHTSIQIIGSGVVIAAPPRVQVKADLAWKLISELHEESIQQERDEEEQNRVEHARAVDELEHKYLSVRDRLIETQSQLNRERAEIRKLEFQVRPSRELPENAEEINNEIMMRQSRYTELEFLSEELMARYEYLRQTLIESQYANLFEYLD